MLKVTKTTEAQARWDSSQSKDLGCMGRRRWALKGSSLLRYK